VPHFLFRADVAKRRRINRYYNQIMTIYRFSDRYNITCPKENAAKQVKRLERTREKRVGIVRRAALRTVSRKDMAAFAVASSGFFMGRVAVFGDIAPAAIPFAAAFFLSGKAMYMAAAFTAIGVLTRLPFVFAVKYLVALGLMCAANAFRKRRVVRENADTLRSLGVPAVLLASGIMAAIVSGGYLYYILIAFLDAALAFSIGVVLRRGVGALSIVSDGSALTNEDMISLCLLAGGLIAGAADIYIGPVSMRHFLCAAIVMAFAGRGGMAQGAAAGLTLGLVTHMAGFEDASFIVTYAVAGFACGALRQFIRIIRTVGFAATLLAMTFYFSPERIGQTLIFSLIAAMAAHMLMPQSVMSGSESAAASKSATHGADGLLAAVDKKVNAMADAFRLMASVVKPKGQKHRGIAQKDVGNIIDEAAQAVCSACEKSSICWGTDFYEVYRAVFLMLGDADKYGTIDRIPEDFYCVREVKFTQALLRSFEEYKTSIKWKARADEARLLAADQFAFAARILREKESLSFDIDAENELLQIFRDNNLGVDSVTVLKTAEGRYEVNIGHKPCSGALLCERQITPLLYRVFKRRMKRDDSDCQVTTNNGKSQCVVSYIEEQKFKMFGAISRIARDDISGDSHSFMELRGGRCVMALSDGMGSGSRAKEESRAAVELLEGFLEAGYEHEESVRMINAALLLRSGAESFSTLDICSVDLYNAEAQFLKVGASTTFILRDGTVSVVRGESLPAGVVSDADVDITIKKLRDGDIIAMVTDGSLEDGVGESVVIEALKAIRSKNPQDIADYITASVRENAQGVIRDDITVAVARLTQRF